MLAPMFSYSGCFGCQACKAMSVGNLFQGHSVRNRGTTGKRRITEGRLPVPSKDKLGTVQKSSSFQISPGEIGAIEYRFEEVRTLQTGTRQIRVAEFCSSEVGTAEIR